MKKIRNSLPFSSIFYILKRNFLSNKFIIYIGIRNFRTRRFDNLENCCVNARIVKHGKCHRYSGFSGDLFLFWNWVQIRVWSAPVIFVSDTFKYVLWKFKQRKKIPNFQTFIGEVFFIIQTAANNSEKICRGIAENNLITNFLQARG